MAKRRKLEAPSAADINQLEAEFRRETSDRLTPAAAPIAQVAADAAGQAVVDSNGAAEQALIKAQEDGRLIVEVPLDQIDANAVPRDRLDMSAEAFEELKISLQANGLRLPIEVYPLPPRDGGQKYGLISGYRRLAAFQELAQIYAAEFQTIKALIRPAKDGARAFSAMVEENEIRENLSHFERGRIASLAAHQGAFANTEDAVDRLFGTASKAKRSKIRSFALIFESLGDLLIYPKDLREKDGLQIANALRMGAEKRLRQVLDDTAADTPEEERGLLLSVAAEFLESHKAPSKGGRPKKAVPRPGWVNSQEMRLSSGISLIHDHDGQGHVIHVKGDGVDRKFMERILTNLQYMLEEG